MHSTENARRSQRRRPDLNINTSPPSASVRSRDIGAPAGALPQTPPPGRRHPPVSSSSSSSHHKGTSSRALRGHGGVPTSRHAPSTAEHDSYLVDGPSAALYDMSSGRENVRPPRETPPPPPRDSHDLSLPARNVTRDSLMTNMLLSLDQLSIGQASSQYGTTARTMYDDDDDDILLGDGLSRNFSAKDRRGTNTGHGYSYSSDLEGADDSSRISSQLSSRGRRSNSSSNFQSGLGRINSMRESLRGSLPSTPRQQQMPSRSGGGRASKHSSGSNSIDAGYAQVLSSTRWAQGFGGRSSSFDYGHRQSNSHSQGQWHIEFSNSFFNSSNHNLNGNDADPYDDAAPTPTVPAGPRRAPPPTPSAAVFTPPPEPTENPKSPGLERKRSTRSARSLTGRKAESKFSASRGETMPPLPSASSRFDLDSAPAPHVGYEKSKESAHGGGPNATHATSQGKSERPGFFRRVFGGGSSKHSSERSVLDTQFSTASTETADHRPGSKPQHTTSNMKSSQAQSTPPSRDTSSSHSHHHVLQKKPSSFFRRRKKSISEEAPPLPTAVPSVPSPPQARQQQPARPQSPPPQIPEPQTQGSQAVQPTIVPPVRLPPPQDRLSPMTAEPSPVSSLRRVMNPYLKGGPSTPATPNPLSSHPVDFSPGSGRRGDSGTKGTEEADRYQRRFSPEYEPSPNAVIRTVTDPESGNEAPWSPGTESPARRNDTPTRPPPEIPTSSPEARNNSFLNLDGASDSELSPPVAKKGFKKDRRPPALDGDASTMLSGSPKSEASPGTEQTSQRTPLEAPTDSEEEASRLALPIEGARSFSVTSAHSTDTNYKTAPSQAPSVNVAPPSSPPRDASEPAKAVPGNGENKPIDEPDFVVGEPTEDERAKAKRIFDGDESFIQKEKAAAWMGEEGIVRQRTLRAYMELYDFQGCSILDGLRQVCGRLVFRAETQQVDRILVSFSNRWCECNTTHGFKAFDVIHTICYSIMLLNTDLHLAEIDQKMTKSQFVKNTMKTIVQAVGDAAPHAFDRPTILPEGGPALSADNARPSVDQDRWRNRMSFLPPARSESGTSGIGTNEECGPLVKTPFEGTLRAWEAQIEIVLKDIYTSIKDERLPLYGAETGMHGASQTNLTVMGMLKRSPSTLSQTPSESMSSLRGRIADATSRSSTNRWGSKSRSRPRGFGGTGFSSSRTSFDDGNSIWSPAGSSATWSKQSLGRTQTSMSMDSFGSAWHRGEYPQSIGFANALSHAIIKEDTPGGATPSILSDDTRHAPLIEDESLELAGPPWVKEGIVMHKHHLDGSDKKAKDRTWTEVFAVVQKGRMSLFSFAPNKSIRSKGRSRNTQGGGNGKQAVAVGGGNWQENATSLGTFNLRQTLASALPPPGYSRQRPHVWALSLPTGAVHLFQVGTPEIIREFVNTANYWSARLSTHPLVGGISNVEYGWGDSIVNNALVSAINESTAPAPPSGRLSRPGSSTAATASAIASSGGRSSIQSGRSYRSGSLDHGSLHGGASGNRNGKLPGDRIHIADWTPPTQSMRPSTLGEGEQLETLTAYVQGIEDELQSHNQLRSPMMLAYTPGRHNAARALANWQKKSDYLLREIVKFKTYVDCMREAEKRKDEIYAERETARRAARGELDEGEVDEPVNSEGMDRDATIRA